MARIIESGEPVRIDKPHIYFQKGEWERLYDDHYRFNWGFWRCKSPQWYLRKEVVPRIVAAKDFVNRLNGAGNGAHY